MLRGIMRDMSESDLGCSNFAQLWHVKSISDCVIASPSAVSVGGEVVHHFESSGFTLFDRSESKTVCTPREVCAVNDNVV